MNEWSTQKLKSFYSDNDKFPKVSWCSFKSRINRAIKSVTPLTQQRLKDALYLNKDAYFRKYASRKTYLEVNGKRICLNEYYESLEKLNISYHNFRQRVTKVSKVPHTAELLQDAAYMDQAKWVSFYGGGRKHPFTYYGEYAPELNGKSFLSITSFLHRINRYSDRSFIWGRVKAGWDMDSALTAPKNGPEAQVGIIYQLFLTHTGQSYVGLTTQPLKVRFNGHVNDANNGSKTALCKAIRKNGKSAFEPRTLEQDIPIDTLADSERYWINELDCLGRKGLNSVKGGSLGGGRKKTTIYLGEKYSSLKAACDYHASLSGLQVHIVRRYVKADKPLPAKARSQSKHPDAGSNLWRRHKNLLNAIARGTRSGEVSFEWLNYDTYKRDVSEGYKRHLNLVRRDNAKPWGRDNFQWADDVTKIATVHGKAYVVFDVQYPSIKAVADAFGIGVSTLKYRLNQGMNIEEAASKPIGCTSYKNNEPITIDDREFRSITDAARFLAGKNGTNIEKERWTCFVKVEGNLL